MSDDEYNMHKASTMTEIDRILDKIKASGYGSLTDEEKRKLFEQSKK
jgi:ribosome maturation protein Sdo1